MNVLVIGSGGREHTLAWKIAQSPLLNKQFVAPGNSGSLEVGENVPLSPNDFEGIAQFIRRESIDLVVVGPEEPLVKGIRNYIEEQSDLSHVGVIGPDADGARLEGSKDFAKAFMMENQIPTARYQSFSVREGQELKEILSAARKYMEGMKPPYVLKADGLAAGKGVLIIDDLEEALGELEQMFTGKFGDAGSTVVIEEHLSGVELSVFILTDGVDYVLLPEAKDYKRIGEGDTGLNTGGMGAISPVPFADKLFMEKVKSRIIEPTLRGLKAKGAGMSGSRIPNPGYRGFIFFGLMNVAGDPYVIEYNVRMGDPEAEVVIPRIKSDLLELFAAIRDNRLGEYQVEISPEAATTVMLVSGGYPGAYEKGMPITGLDQIDDAVVFHAGSAMKENRLVTSGGRVMAVTALDADWQQALRKSYRNAERIRFKGLYYRKDLGFDLK